MNRRTYLKASAALSGCVLLPAGVLALVGHSGKPQSHELNGFDGAIMGTRYSVRLGTSTGSDAGLSQDAMRNLAKQVYQELLTVDTRMSTWRSDSDVSMFNNSVDLDWQTVSPQTIEVMAAASHISELSRGSFDVTIGPLVDLWGFGAGAEKLNHQTSMCKPAERDIVQQLKQVGHDLIDVDTRANALRKHTAKLQIDLSGIAKGYAVDRVANLLDSKGINSYLVEVGGELRSQGRKPDGSVWKVAIERPANGQRNVFRIVQLDNKAVATSGNYRNFFIDGGQRYSHAIDPRTGQSVDHELASVSVVADSTMQADALSTAMMIMGPDKALDFAEQQSIAAHLILKSGAALTEVYSSAFKPMIV